MEESLKGREEEAENKSRSVYIVGLMGEQGTEVLRTMGKHQEKIESQRLRWGVSRREELFVNLHSEPKEKRAGNQGFENYSIKWNTFLFCADYNQVLVCASKNRERGYQLCFQQVWK